MKFPSVYKRPMAQSDGNLNVRTTDSSVQRNPKNGRQTETHRKTLGNTSEELKFHQIYIQWQRIKRDRWHNSRAKHAVLLTHVQSLLTIRTDNAIYNTMHVMQCNANARKCNVCKKSGPSVRTEWSQSVIFFFFFFSQYVTEVRQYVRNTNVTDGQTSFSYFSCQYVRMSRMDRQVSVILFSFSSVAYSQGPSVRTEVQPKKEKKKYVTVKQTNTDPIGGITFNGKKNLLLNLLNDGNNSWNHSDGRINVHAPKKKCYVTKINRKHTENLKSSWQCTYQIPLNAIQCIVTAIQCAMQCNGKCNVAVLIGVWVCVCMCMAQLGCMLLNWQVDYRSYGVDFIM
jgi:hypothetical protein